VSSAADLPVPPAQAASSPDLTNDDPLEKPLTNFRLTTLGPDNAALKPGDLLRIYVTDADEYFASLPQ
jgi:hypothetical protein